MRTFGRTFGRLILLLLCVVTLPAQLSYERLLNAETEPGNWLTYSGAYKSNHYSKLDEISRETVGDLELKWVFQAGTTDKLQSTPLVVDGVMYLTEGSNDVVALDARTGRAFWRYEHSLPERINLCCGHVNRGLAMSGDRLYQGTLDGRFLALDSKTGAVLWDRRLVDNTKGYSLTVAPLAVKNKIILGTAGGEYGIRGFIDAYDPETGERIWRFHTIPGPGEPGHETWENDAWKTGGGSAWITGSFDPELNLLYWGVGNPAPDWNPEVRPGDNLYTGSVVALDVDTGELKWHFQFTPHDEWDYDAVQIPVLVDREFRGRQRKLMLWGNRNAFYYVLDRETGEFLLGKAFTRQTWAKGLDEKGRPIKIPGMGPSKEGKAVYPRRARGDELVRPLLQSADRSVLPDGLGRLLGPVLRRRTGLHAGQLLRRRPGEASLSQPDVAGGSGLRRRPRAGPEHGRVEVGVQDDGDLRKRSAVDGGRCSLLGQF